MTKIDQTVTASYNLPYQEGYLTWIQDKVKLAKSGQLNFLRNYKVLTNLSQRDCLNRVSKISICLASTEAATVSTILIAD